MTEKVTLELLRPLVRPGGIRLDPPTRIEVAASKVPWFLRTGAAREITLDVPTSASESPSSTISKDEVAPEKGGRFSASWRQRPKRT